MSLNHPLSMALLKYQYGDTGNPVLAEVKAWDVRERNAPTSIVEFQPDEGDYYKASKVNVSKSATLPCSILLPRVAPLIGHRY